MSFYVCLPSNACSKEFPSNTQSNYNTILKKPLVFDSYDYEVAITELVYSPNYLANFGSLLFNDQIIELRFKNGLEKSQIIEALNTSVRDFCLENISLKEYQDKLKFQTIPFFTDQFSLLFKGKIKIVGSLSMILCNKNEIILRGSDSFHIEEEKLFVSNYAAIYTNIVDEQYFGDTFAPLLRCINLSTKNESVVSTSFENLLYVPVNKRMISTINIKICDLEGQLIRFQNIFSFVIVTLHFRKKTYA